MSRFFLVIFLPAEFLLLVILNRYAPRLLVRLLFNGAWEERVLLIGPPGDSATLEGWLKSKMGSRGTGRCVRGTVSGLPNGEITTLFSLGIDSATKRTDYQVSQGHFCPFAIKLCRAITSGQKSRFPCRITNRFFLTKPLNGFKISDGKLVDAPNMLFFRGPKRLQSSIFIGINNLL
jgi:hypothetical protein